MAAHSVLRWVHILSATAWYGEVVTINLVLVPAVQMLAQDERGRVLVQIFPRIFKLASWLSGTAVLSGLALFFWRFNGAWSTLHTTWSGRAFVAGATLGLVLTAFHFILEPRLETAICTSAEEPKGELAEQVMRTLKIVPRVGLGVITLALVLMMVGARGFF